MARQTRSRRTERDTSEAAAGQQGLSERARERRRRVKPVAEVKAQTGQKRERQGGFRQFVRESVAELKKVEWPSQRQLVSATVVVVIAIFVVGLYLWVLDEAISRFVRNVLLR